MHYRMPETGASRHARMVEAGEAEAVRGRHLVYFLRLVERLEPKLRSGEQIATLDRLEGELDNLRLALEWALQVDIEAELRLTAALMWLWHIRVLHTEGIAWLSRA
jgi:predicted ATPase